MLAGTACLELRNHSSCAKKACGVAVVAAGMHEACPPACVGLSGLLLDRQCIHVGPKPESGHGLAR